MRDKNVEVAYILEDVEAPNHNWIIKKGCVFRVSKKDHSKLHGLWKSGTDDLKTVIADENAWSWKDKISYYSVPDECFLCKYCKFYSDHCECEEYQCVG